jgi:hypothetical protein
MLAFGKPDHYMPCAVCRVAVVVCPLEEELLVLLDVLFRVCEVECEGDLN